MRQFVVCLVSFVFASTMLGCGGSKDEGAVADNSAGAAAPGGEAAAPGAEGSPAGMSGMGGMAGMAPMGPPGGEGSGGGEGAAGGLPGGMPGAMPSGPPGGMPGGPPGGMPPGYGGRTPGAGAGTESGGAISGATPGSPGGLPSPGVAGAAAGGGGFPMPPGIAGLGAGGEGGRGTEGGELPSGGLPGGIGPGGIPGGIPGGVGGAGYPGAGGVPGAGDGTGGDGTIQAPTTYDAFAKQAFEQGRENDAMRYLLAWALTSDAGASDVLSGYQWVTELRRPVAAVRWGVGIQVTMPKGFAGDMKPIGSQQALGGARDGNAAPGGIGGFDPGGIGGGAGGGGELERLAGEFGSKMLEQFQARVTAGKFGKALKDAPGSMSNSGAAGGFGGAGGAGGFASGPGGAGGLGLGIGGGADGPGAGRRGPGMGRGPGGKPGGFAGAGAGGDGGAGGAGRGDAAMSAQLTPGLTLLGLGTDKELKERAAKEGIDVLAFFKVKVSVNRAGIIINDTEADILLVKGTLKEPIGSAVLNNIKVQKDRDAAKSDSKEDSVDKEVKRLFDKVDAKLVMTTMPAALTPEMVKSKRVEGQLLTGVIDDPLSVLAEIRFYHRNKLLNDADTAAAFAKVAGAADGKTLLEGKEEDRKKVVEKWLPKT